MRIHIGAIPEDHAFQPEIEGWSSFNKLGPVAIQLVTVPIAMIVPIFLMACFNAVIPGAIYRPKLLIFSYEIWQPFVAILLLVPLHEIIHALCYPQMGLSDQTVIGFWPQKVLVYAFYSGTLTRVRFMVTMLTPFGVLSFLPIALIAAFPKTHFTPSFLAFLTVVSILNGIASSGDILGAALVFWRLPKEAVIRNRGWQSYWITAEMRAAQNSASSMPTSSSSSP